MHDRRKTSGDYYMITVAFSTEGTGSSTIVGKRDYLGYQYRGGTSGDRIIMIIAQVTIHMQNNVWTWQG